MFNRFANAWNRYKKRRATMNELSTLTDKELSDIGITRSDIARIVKNTTY